MLNFDTTTIYCCLCVNAHTGPERLKANLAVVRFTLAAVLHVHCDAHNYGRAKSDHVD